MPHAQCRGMSLAEMLAILFVLVLLVALLMPSLGRGYPNSNRSVCAAKLRGIVQSMAIYAQDNLDTFPLVPNVNGSLYINDPGLTGTVPATTDFNIEIAGSYNGGTDASNGAASSNPSRSLWLLVLRNQVGVKSFLCKQDPAITGYAPITNASNQYYGNFQSTSLSYSIAYPWANTSPTAGPGGWWKNTTASDIPVLSDMAPEHATGTGPGLRDTAARKGAPGTPKIYSSNNHAGNGQNVAFADNHVEFVKDPYVGQHDDNIWTCGPSRPTGPGGTPVTRGHAMTPFTPAAAATAPTTTSPSPTFGPFDIYMVPVRNVSTNGM